MSKMYAPAQVRRLTKQSLAGRQLARWDILDMSSARVGLVVQHAVVIVLIKAKIHPDPVTETKQQLKLGVVAELYAPLDADRRPLKSALQVALLGEQLSQQVAGTWRHG